MDYSLSPSRKSKVLAQALQETSGSLGELLRLHPQGLQSLLALWQILAMDPLDEGVGPALDKALEHLSPRDILEQAIETGNVGLMRALRDRGVPIERLSYWEGADDSLPNQAPSQDEYGPVSSTHEHFLLARLVGDTAGAVPFLSLRKFSRLVPGRIGCTMTPASTDNTTSWLALALFVGQFDQAEHIWKDRLEAGGQWSVKERAEASLAWWGGVASWKREIQAAAPWWDRLMAPDVAVHPLPIRPGWGQVLRANSDARFFNLKGHTEAALAQAQSGQSADILGVLIRAMDLAPQAPQIARPVDLAIDALAQISLPGLAGEGEAFMQKVRAFDWGSVPPDAQGRTLAMAALDQGWAANPSLRVPARALDDLWLPLVRPLGEKEQEIWWSLAASLAIQGYTPPLVQSTSLFRQRFDGPVSQAVATQVGDYIDRKGGALGQQAMGILERFWKTIVPCIIHASTPDVALYWENRRLEMLPRLGALKPNAPGSESRMEEMVMDLKTPLPTPSKGPKSRL